MGHMRRLLALALVVSAGVVTGCSGVDAQKAQGILDQSTSAMADVKSVSFAMRMWTSGGPAGTDFNVLMHGGGYQKGKRAGESYATLNAGDVPGLGAMTIVIRDNVLYVKAGGSWAQPTRSPGSTSPGTSPTSVSRRAWWSTVSRWTASPA
jgi:hypothetical protein